MRRSFILLLIIVTLSLGAGAIYMGYKLSETPDEVQDQDEDKDQDDTTDTPVASGYPSDIACNDTNNPDPANCVYGDSASDGRCNVQFQETRAGTGCTEGKTSAWLHSGAGWPDGQPLGTSTAIEGWDECKITRNPCDGEGYDTYCICDSTPAVTVRGQVYCQDDGSTIKYPMKGVTISITHASTTNLEGSKGTGADGKFSFVIPPGSYEAFNVRHWGVADSTNTLSNGTPYSALEIKDSYCDEPGRFSCESGPTCFGGNDFQYYRCFVPESSTTAKTYSGFDFIYKNCGTIDPQNSCGDNICNTGENCEMIDGVPTSCSTNAQIATCRSDCTFCGDGVVQPGEDCDHGGTPTAICDANCQTVLDCGDTCTDTSECPTSNTCDSTTGKCVLSVCLDPAVSCTDDMCDILIKPLPQTALIDDRSDTIILALIAVVGGLLIIKFDLQTRLIVFIKTSSVTLYQLSPFSDAAKQKIRSKQRKKFEDKLK